MSSFEESRFKKGQGGRVKGARNRISYKLLTALADDFEQHGEEAIRICRVERPNEYLKIIVSTMPKEFEITDSRLQEISDDELEILIDRLRQERSSIRTADSGTGETAH
jgi:hypothetical protein